MTPIKPLVPFRSALYVPAHKSHFLEKAFSSDADVLLLDLEDSVPLNEKVAARMNLCDFYQNRQALLQDKFVFIRLNESKSSEFEKDVEFVSHLPVNGFVFPKAETVEQIHFCEKTIETHRESLKQIEPFFIFLLIETALGILNMDDLVQSSSRIIALGLGESDLSANLHASIEYQNPILLHSRCCLITVAHAHQLIAVDSPFWDIADTEGLLKQKSNSHKMGFDGSQLIHPSHISFCNRSFSPSPEQVSYAREILITLEKAQQSGDGVAVLHGQMIDEATAVYARQILELQKNLQ